MSRSAKISKEELSRRMRQVFRAHGYEGASMQALADSAGMSKAALYHFFPDGKGEMASAVLDDLKQWVLDHILQPLREEGSPRERLERLSESLGRLYESGEQPCLMGLFSSGEALALFRTRLQNSFRTLIQTVSAVLMDAGLPRRMADQRAEDLVIRIQGALVLCRAFDDIGPFSRLRDRMADDLLLGTDFERRSTAKTRKSSR